VFNICLFKHLGFGYIYVFDMEIDLMGNHFLHGDTYDAYVPWFNFFYVNNRREGNLEAYVGILWDFL
jgi:hypothetical protein